MQDMEVDEILLQEAMLLPRSMRQEADKVRAGGCKGFLRFLEFRV